VAYFLGFVGCRVPQQPEVREKWQARWDGSSGRRWIQRRCEYGQPCKPFSVYVLFALLSLFSI